MAENPPNKVTLKKKEKGGAAKEREKRKRLLVQSAHSCKKISSLFVTKKSKNSQEGTVIEQPKENQSNTTCDAIIATTELQEPREHTSQENDDKCEQSKEAHVITSLNETTEKNTASSSSVSHNLNLTTGAVKNENEDPSEEFYFKKPENHDLDLFLKGHPRRFLKCAGKINTDIIYHRKSGTERNWLSYNKDKKTFYCWICLAFVKEENLPILATGISGSVKHVYTRIEEHELSRVHINSAEAYLLHKSERDIHSLLFSTAAAERRAKVEKNRQVLLRVIETIKTIGKRGLSYRGDGSSEAAYTLLNENVDHGNFLEIILLISKFDPLLRHHIEKVAKESEKIHISKAKKQNTIQGRGNLTTFLSKTTVNLLIEGISSLIKQKIADEIKNAKIYSVQIDTTQDINVVDQCSVVVRYVHSNRVNERLIKLINCTSTKGKDLFEIVAECLRKFEIDIGNCVGNSTDGASNMQGQYKGFTSWLSKDSPGQVHVWCYAHVLNLVICDITKLTNPAATLFGLINKCAAFVKESHLRMNVWKEAISSTNTPNLKFVNLIGETRWWAKEKALTKIFNIQTGIFVELCETLYAIKTSDNFNSETKYNSGTLLESFLKYETVITAIMFKRIFVYTTPLSNYLQTAGMDFLQAYRMVDETLKSFKDMNRDFDQIYTEANKFISMVNDRFLEKDLPLEVEDSFPQRRIRRKQKFYDENCSDEAVQEPLTKFKIEIFYVTMDRIIGALECRFLNHKELYKDFECLHPGSFSLYSRLPESALECIYAKLEFFFPEVKLEELKQQWTDFVSKWSRLNQSLSEEYFQHRIKEIDEEIEVDTEFVGIGSHKFCKNCISCCYNVIMKYNLFAEAYPALQRAYQYLLTLSVTQVACERSFSKLNFILNKVRSCLTQEHLEAFMLMSIEKDILISLQNEEIIDHLMSHSKNMRNLLSL